VNDVFAGRADLGELKEILAYSEEPLVSSDIVGSPDLAVLDAGYRSLVDETGVKVLAWCDNQCGYATRLAALAERAGAFTRPGVSGPWPPGDRPHR
jgi:glyceraldehyde 3-phosphate dehydrogenase